MFQRRKYLKRNVVRPITTEDIDLQGEALNQSDLIVAADLALRYYLIRQYDGDGVQCFTCPVSSGWKYMEVGHFISRTVYLLRWDIRNVKPQCPKCNQAGGRREIYESNLEQLQPGLPNELILLSHQPFRLTNDFILQKIRSLQ
jgi:5-methylcytosine-specific restriction endonuclease McrA